MNVRDEDKPGLVLMANRRLATWQLETRPIFIAFWTIPSLLTDAANI